MLSGSSALDLFHFLTASRFLHSVDGHFDCLQFLATVNNAAVDMLAHISSYSRASISVGYVPSRRIIGDRI